LTDLGKKKCSICDKESRNKYIIAVVEEYLDMQTLELSGSFD